LVKIFSQSKDYIVKSVKNGDVTIAVFGLGSIGLPIAVIFANAGARVIGVDIDEKRVNLINTGSCYIENEPELNKLFQTCYHSGRISATTNLLKGAKESDVKIVVVPTLLTQFKTPDLSAVESVVEHIGKGLSKNDVIILESSVPPGTTEGIVKDILEKNSGLKAGKDFGLVFSPERVMSGSIIEDFTTKYPKIVGGLNESSSDTVIALYSSVITNKIIKVRDAKTAETIKVFKGIYRDVNIALANELALIAEKLGLDVIEIINAANTEPYSNIHVPGAGVGGHCIPFYPYFVLDAATKVGIKPTLIKVARNLNENMPNHVVELITDGLKEVGKSLKTSRIAIFGLTFRGDVKICINSPASEVITKLKATEAKLIAYDPLLEKDEVKSYFDVRFVSKAEQAAMDADCIVIITAHSVFKNLKINDLAKQMKMPGVIVDARHIVDPGEVLKSGLVYRGIGRVPKSI